MKTWKMSTALRWLYRHWAGGFALILAGIVAGALLAGWVFKPAYTADAVFSVGFNADAVLRYPEDYKNWQMAQVDSFVTSPRVLNDTLAALPQDPYWQNWDAATLSRHLSARWFTAGDWHLHATADTAAHASILAATWGVVALRDIQDAIAHGVKFLEADRRWEQAQSEMLAVEVEIAHLSDAESALAEWQKKFADGAVQSITPEQAAELNYWAAFAAFPDNPYKPLTANAQPKQAAEWVTAALARVRAAQKTLEDERSMLEQIIQRAAAEREENRKATGGVSTEWRLLLKGGKTAGVPQLEEHAPALWANTTAIAKRLHPTAHAVYSWKDGAAVGGLAALMLWVVLALVAAIQTADEEAGRG